MFTVVIVDDEPLLRLAVTSGIDWEAMGCRVVGEASNGEEAVEMIRHFDPDLVITDILMPVINGIGLIKKMKEEGIKSKIIVLSSHDDFKFVRESLLLGASDYLLKSDINQDTLAEIVLNTLNQTIHINAQDPATGDRLLGQDLHDILFSEISVETQLKILEEAGITKNCTEIVVTCIKCQDLSADTYSGREEMRKLLITSVRDILLQSEFGPLCVYGGHGFFFCIYGLDGITKVNFYEQLTRGLERVRIMIERCTNLSVIAGVSRVCSLGTSLYRLKEQALACIYEHFYCPSQFLFTYESIGKFGSKKQLDYQYTEMVYWIKTEIMEAGRKKTYEYLSGRWKRLEQERYFPADVAQTAVHLLQFISNYVSKDKIEADLDFETFIQQAANFRTWLELSEWLDYGLKQMLEWMDFYDTNLQNQHLLNAVSYIRDHYNNPELSLQMVAKAISVNASYLSRLFYQQKGITYTGFLTKIRIEHAKKLLRNSYDTIEEISFKIGFNNSKYFCKVFKAETGKTPTQYKKGN
ncbi:response regulator [Hungatella sp. L12]|uniref:Stage 0 sporulation protein A homolog n=1 Tax=Hungatella hominis TaxID=2763050 RepID=A0ABR7HAX0_9FIRM|nr:response regulator [Hungatella hominis]MBC5710347.1 response regulator [Hungatella hominis]